MINSMKTNQEILMVIAERVKSRRISLQMTQEELSVKSGLSLKTIASLENGKGSTLNTLLQVLRELKWLELLDVAIPALVTDPYEILNRGHKAKRVRPVTNTQNQWKWGDE